MPGARCTHGPRAIKKHAAEPQVQPNIRPSLRNGFTAYSVLSSGTGLSCPRHPQDAVRVFANLTPASGRQDHTISPSAIKSFVS